MKDMLEVQIFLFLMQIPKITYFDFQKSGQKSRRWIKKTRQKSRRNFWRKFFIF